MPPSPGTASMSTSSAISPPTSTLRRERRAPHLRPHGADLPRAGCVQTGGRVEGRGRFWFRDIGTAYPLNDMVGVQLREWIREPPFHHHLR
jgi:hypothetical protein